MQLDWLDEGSVQLMMWPTRRLVFAPFAAERQTVGRTNRGCPVIEGSLNLRNYVTLIVVIGILFVPAWVHAQETCRVTGTLLERGRDGDALMPGFDVTFASDTVRIVVNTGPAGEYQVDLPIGKYSVSSNPRGFYPVQRAPFEVKPKTTIMINLTVMFHPITIYNLGPQQLDFIESPEDPLKTEVFPTTSAMIRFARRTETARSAEYRGGTFRSGKERFDVVPVLTYDALSISANRFVVEKGSMKVRAVGSVVIEDGKVRRLGREAFIDLGSVEPIATLKVQGR